MFFIIQQYLPILFLLFIAIGLASVILGASYFLGIQKPDIEKVSIYECGFDPYDDSRNSFDVRFYIIAILFIIFDLEALFLFPWTISLSHLTSMGFWTMADFLIELVIGFIYAWKLGGLEWE